MYNKVFLIGNLTRDPEVRYTTSGLPVARFAIAVNRPGNKKAGTPGEVDYINIVAWRRLAEICKEYLKKGKPVEIEGRLQIRKYEQGGEKKTYTEVIADSMQMLGKREEGQGVKQEIPESSTHEEIKSDKSEEEEVPF